MFATRCTGRGFRRRSATNRKKPQVSRKGKSNANGGKPRSNATPRRRRGKQRRRKNGANMRPRPSGSGRNRNDKKRSASAFVLKRRQDAALKRKSAATRCRSGWEGKSPGRF